MTEARSPEAVLARIPGWRGAAWRPLDGGSGNHTYLVTRRGRRAVLKIDAAPRSAPHNSRATEACIQARASAAGLGGRVFYHDAITYLCEYVDGEIWQKRDFCDDDRLGKLAAALRRLHALPAPASRLDGASAARLYASGIVASDRDAARQHLATIEAMPQPEELCFCHNDLVAGNILLAAGIRFIDWEYAAGNDPFFDLATIVAHHDLPEERSAVLLDAYCDGAAAADRDRLARWCSYYRALLWLWERAVQ